MFNFLLFLSRRGVLALLLMLHFVDVVMNGPEPFHVGMERRKFRLNVFVFLLQLFPFSAPCGDGQLAVLGKARGAKQSNNFLNEAITKRGGIDFSQPLMLGYSGSSDEALREYIAASREIWERELDTLPVTSIGSTIGTHVGPGAIVVAFFAKET